LTTLAALMAMPASAAADPGPPNGFVQRHVAFEGHSLSVHDYPGRGAEGEKPPLVLMHGFPDSVRLYDQLIPELKGRRIVAFDFLGWGDSDKPHPHDYTFAEQERELDAVVRSLNLGSIVPVAHDGSGPPAINWSLAHRDQVAGLVLLNTFYSAMPTTNPPEAIRLFSDPAYNALTEAIGKNEQVNRWLFHWQVGKFMSSPATRKRVLSVLWRQFRSAQPAFASLNRDLIPAIAADTARTGELNGFDRPVRIVFGARDPYLNEGMARSFHELFPTSDLFLLPARHYVQVDAPARVAQLIQSMPLA
jgi:pimeloyl-ACP methyl ester carboxylesterase